MKTVINFLRLKLHLLEINSLKKKYGEDFEISIDYLSKALELA